MEKSGNMFSRSVLQHIVDVANSQFSDEDFGLWVRSWVEAEGGHGKRLKERLSGREAACESSGLMRRAKTTGLYVEVLVSSYGETLLPLIKTEEDLYDYTDIIGLNGQDLLASTRHLDGGNAGELKQGDLHLPLVFGIMAASTFLRRLRKSERERGDHAENHTFELSLKAASALMAHDSFIRGVRFAMLVASEATKAVIGEPGSELGPLKKRPRGRPESLAERMLLSAERERLKKLMELAELAAPSR